MERLKKDIPKFLDNSRIVSNDHKAWWHNFFSEADTIYSADMEKPSTWLLNELKLIKFRSAFTPGPEDQSCATMGNSCEFIDVPESISEDVHALVQAQLEDIPEVHTINFI